MSDRIEEILDVLREIRSGYVVGMSRQEVEKLRMSAERTIAGRRAIHYTTVSNKYRRGLRPEVVGTRQFDDAVFEWLSSGSSLLKAVLLRHALSSTDSRAIERFFDSFQPPVPAPFQMEEAPLDEPVDALLRWLDENERRASALPGSELARRAAAANPIPRRLETTHTVFVRDSFVAAEVKRLAAGRCDLCRETAPFTKTDGEPFLEEHHVQWLSRGGLDALDNAVALCPNCHRKMHVLDDDLDVQSLRTRTVERSS